MMNPTTKLVLDPSSSIDLHMHTNYSDGRWPAQQLIDYLVKEQFDLVAVTDHDRVDKVAEIQALAAEKHLLVLSGVEMTTQWNGKLAHLLCYGFDPAQNYLQDVTAQVKQRQRADIAETVDAAHRSGALCLIAHPGRRESGFTFYDTELLDQVRASVPIDGIEVYHPYHTSDVIETYLEYVQKHDLLLSTGSDSHGIPGRMPRKHRAEISKKLLARLGITLTPDTSLSS